MRSPIPQAPAGAHDTYARAPQPVLPACVPPPALSWRSNPLRWVRRPARLPLKAVPDRVRGFCRQAAAGTRPPGYCVGEQAFRGAPPAIRDQQNASALAAGASGSAAAVEQCLGVTRRFCWMTRPRSGRSRPPRRNVGGDTDAGMSVAQRLKRVRTLGLAKLTRHQPR